MSKPKVYLAGPIAGLTFDEAQEAWRSVVMEKLSPDIEGFSPLRNKGYLKSVGVITTTNYLGPLSCDRGILVRDHWDCKTADAIFVNLLGAQRVSQGTVMEIAWAYAYRKPLIVVIEAENNLHDHPMIREAIDYRVTTLGEAIAITRAILLPHVYTNQEVNHD